MFLLSYFITVALCLILTGIDVYRKADYKLSVGDLLTLLFITFVPLVNSFCVIAFFLFIVTEKFRKFNYQHVLWSKKK